MDQNQYALEPPNFEIWEDPREEQSQNTVFPGSAGQNEGRISPLSDFMGSDEENKENISPSPISPMSDRENEGYNSPLSDFTGPGEENKENFRSSSELIEPGEENEGNFPSSSQSDLSQGSGSEADMSNADSLLDRQFPFRHNITGTLAANPFTFIQRES